MNPGKLQSARTLDIGMPIASRTEKNCFGMLKCDNQLRLYSSV